MKYVDVSEINAYTWECPNCGHFNCHDVYCDMVCDGCGEQFELGEITNDK